jgi:hypothetical protein
MCRSVVASAKLEWKQRGWRASIRREAKHCAGAAGHSTDGTGWQADAYSMMLTRSHGPDSRSVFADEHDRAPAAALSYTIGALNKRHQHPIWKRRGRQPPHTSTPDCPRATRTHLLAAPTALMCYLNSIVDTWHRPRSKQTLRAAGTEAVWHSARLTCFLSLPPRLLSRSVNRHVCDRLFSTPVGVEHAAEFWRQEGSR